MIVLPLQNIVVQTSGVHVLLIVVLSIYRVITFELGNCRNNSLYHLCDNCKHDCVVIYFNSSGKNITCVRIQGLFGMFF